MKTSSSEFNPSMRQAVHESRATMKSLSESSQVSSSWAFMDVIVILLTVSCDHKPRSNAVKNANPSTPLVYPNGRFRKITTPDANTYCGRDSAVTYFSAMSNKGTCSTPTPKCTSDSFFSLQTPHTTEQVNKNQGRHTATAHKQRKEASKLFQCGYCFKCPR